MVKRNKTIIQCQQHGLVRKKQRERATSIRLARDSSPPAHSFRPNRLVIMFSPKGSDTCSTRFEYGPSPVYAACAGGFDARLACDHHGWP
eukprot:1136555-Pelagomonas_calceolata.AAC.2